MKNPPDVIRFLGGPVGRFEAGWTGPWPPPAELRLAHGAQTGITKVLPDDLDPALAREIELCTSIVVTTYRLRNASRLPDDADRTHVVRGAEYVPAQAQGRFDD